jgi:ubiquinone/menaquinone biosynthesis C-methylase UbiE
MNNRWNRIIYRLWAPVYDRLFDRLFLARGRRQALAALDLQAGESVVLSGVGTGLDLPLLPADAYAVGLDLSPAMLAQARRKLPATRASVDLVLADAQALPLAGGVFDTALLNLILSVAPDGAACWREAVRVLRPAGRAVIYDKFLSGDQPSFLRRLVNVMTRLGGTDITRRLRDLIGGAVVLGDEPSVLRGQYRVVSIRLPGTHP